MAGNDVVENAADVVENAADVVENAAARVLAGGGFWWCGRCRSLIPLTYWHTCNDERTHSTPMKRDEDNL